MEITYKNIQIKKECTNAEVARKKYGVEMARKIHQRIDQIIAASSVEEMIMWGIGRCHSLSQNRKGQYAVDLLGGNRLIFEKSKEGIHIVMIIEITDYH